MLRCENCGNKLASGPFAQSRECCEGVPPSGLPQIANTNSRTSGKKRTLRMTMTVEEFLVLLLVLNTGRPLIADAKRRISKAITGFAQRRNPTRRRGVRARTRIIDIWIERVD